MTSYKKSNALFERAKKTIPGAVNSPVRAWKAVGRSPLFIERGEGAYLIDADDNRFIDYVGSYGPTILGHANPEIAAAIAEQTRRGLGYGAPSEFRNRSRDDGDTNRTRGNRPARDNQVRRLLPWP